MLGDGGLAEQVAPGTLVIDLSAVSVATVLREHAAYDQRGVRFLDAPVFGSRTEAAEGGLWVLVGGESTDFEAARPVLEPIAATLHHIGGNGDGARMKLVGNLLVAYQLRGLGDALTLAAGPGSTSTPSAQASTCVADRETALNVAPRHAATPAPPGGETGAGRGEIAQAFGCSEKPIPSAVWVASRVCPSRIGAVSSAT